MVETSTVRTMGKYSFCVKNGDQEQGIETSDFREKMLRFNKIPGIISPDVRYLDGMKEFEYKLDSLESLKDRCKRLRLSGENLYIILTSLINTLILSREYMLLEDDFLLNQESVFLNSDSSTNLVYFPGYNIPLREQLLGIGEYMLDKVDYKDKQAVVQVYSFYMACKDVGISLEKLLECLEKNKAEIVVSAPGPTTLESSYISSPVEINQVKSVRTTYSDCPSEELKEYQSHISDVINNGPVKLKALSIAIVFATVGGTVALIAANILGLMKISPVIICLIGLINSLILIVSLMKIKSYVIHLKDINKKSNEVAEEPTVLLYSGKGTNNNQEEIILVSDEYPNIVVNHFPFFVGKDEKKVDFVLNQKGISRYHLKIDFDQADGLTISDLNSTNGTSLNGSQLAPHMPYKVMRGDRIKIGVCTYYCN